MTKKSHKVERLGPEQIPKHLHSKIMAVHERLVEEDLARLKSESKEDAQKPECLFCQMAQGKKEVTFFAKFQHCYAIKDQYPVSPGHVLIIPYLHTENWFKASEEVRSDMMQALNFVKEKLDAEYAPQGYNIGANCGEAAGQTVMHLHLHLIPRYQGDMEDPRGGVRGVIPSKQKY